MFQLTAQQLNFMETFGYSHFPGMLADRIVAVDMGFEALITAYGGDSHEGQERFCTVPCINHGQYLSTLLDDERLYGIATDLLGEHYLYWNSDGNYYFDDTAFGY